MSFFSDPEMRGMMALWPLVIGPIGVLCQPVLCAFALPEVALEKRLNSCVQLKKNSYFWLCHLCECIQ